MSYFFYRIFQTVFSLWVLATLTFFLLKIFPGSPYDEDISLHPSVQLQIEKAYGLNQPLSQQYFIFLKDLSEGNFGVSQFFAGKESKEIILRYFPVTLYLSSMSLILALIGSLCLAFIAEANRQGFYFFEATSLILLSTPILLAGPLLIYLFGFYWNLLPVALLETPLSYVLPVIVLSLKPLASMSRILQVKLHENKKLEYVRTARAFGFSESYILLKSVFRNSLVPLIAYLGPVAAFMLTGSTMIEIIFALPGLGAQFVEATINRDASLVIGLTLFYGFFIFIFQMFVDVAISYIDPRTSHK